MSDIVLSDPLRRIESANPFRWASYAASSTCRDTCPTGQALAHLARPVRWLAAPKRIEGAEAWAAGAPAIPTAGVRFPGYLPSARARFWPDAHRDRRGWTGRNLACLAAREPAGDLRG